MPTTLTSFAPGLSPFQCACRFQSSIVPALEKKVSCPSVQAVICHCHCTLVPSKSLTPPLCCLLHCHSHRCTQVPTYQVDQMVWLSTGTFLSRWSLRRWHPGYWSLCHPEGHQSNGTETEPSEVHEDPPRITYLLNRETGPWESTDACRSIYAAPWLIHGGPASCAPIPEAEVFSIWSLGGLRPCREVLGPCVPHSHQLISMFHQQNPE